MQYYVSLSFYSSYCCNFLVVVVLIRYVIEGREGLGLMSRFLIGLLTQIMVVLCVFCFFFNRRGVDESMFGLAVFEELLRQPGESV